MLQQVDLSLEPNEASDLCQVHEPGLLAAQGWDASFLTVLDEAPVEKAIVVLGHRADAAPTEGWSTIEGATFLPGGGLLLGLRFPTSADGHPLLVQVDDVDVLFEGGTPRCGPVWSLEVGSSDRPLGIRAMDGEHVIVGSLEAKGKDSVLLADHPEAGEAGCAHWRRSPLPENGGPVAATLVHDFGDLRSVEGVAVGINGHHLYVIDEESRVQMRFLLIE